MQGAWETKEPTFKKMEMEAGKKLTKTLLIVEINKMAQLLKADMQEVHIEYMAEYILQNYYSYTISDLTALTARLVKNNPYGKPILQNIIHELDEYSNERFAYAEQERIKEAGELKNDLAPDVEILRLYDKLKAEAKKKPETQKEREDRVQAELSEKLKTMAMVYGSENVHTKK